MQFDNGYYEVRFNLTFVKASENITRECKALFDKLIKDGLSEADANNIVSKKADELRDYWFTWIPFKKR